VLRIDVDCHSNNPGQPPSLFDELSRAELNPAFRRLVHDLADPLPDGQPPELAIEGHEHRVILLAESNPPGHLFLHEIVEDSAGTISIQLPGDNAPKPYRVEGWMADDPSRSDTRVAFYDRTALRPQLGRWQLWKFVNTTGDTHPIHIHQSTFQPLGDAGDRLVFADSSGANLYDPMTRRTSAPLVPETGPGQPARHYDPQEVRGWKDVLRVDPGNVLAVAVRFDVPGRYVYHCHVLEHEDTEMMRPLVVTVLDMNDGTAMHM
jgi:spore coat protein A